MHPFPESDKVLYRPSRDVAEGAVLTAFARRLGAGSLGELRKKAEADPQAFWRAVMEDLDWRWKDAPTGVLDLSEGIAWPRWFPGGTTNVVDQILRPERPGAALVWEAEDGAVREFSWGELREAVLRAAGGLAALGIGRGDRVGLLLPMIPETVISFLALAALGAVAVPIFSGYGLQAIVTRLQDASATALITVDGHPRRGKRIALLPVAVEAMEASPSVRRLVVVGRMEAHPDLPAGAVSWDEVRSGPEATPEVLPADHPLMIIYTSGTTGRPKGTVHTHTGFPVKAASDLRLCFDLRPTDGLFWFTDMGWMMGPWSILGAGIVGARAVIFEGTPDYPGPDRLWDVIERHRASVFGVAPTAVRSLMVHGTAPVEEHDLSSLRVLGSTGEPWNPESWEWYFQVVGKGRLPIINYSGGTLGCFVTEPMKPCGFNGPVPGMAARIVDGDGRECRQAVGELVLKGPWVGMTQGFWQDRERYLETYWGAFPDTWRHGDLAFEDEDGFWYLLGRSDDTISVAGKRLSPAEVEALVASHPAVKEAAAVGVPDPLKGEALVLFVVLRPGALQGPDIERAIQDHLVERLGKSFRPRRVHIVGDLPRTRSGKIMRRAVKSSYLGRESGDLSTMENPEVLKEIAGLGTAS